MFFTSHHWWQQTLNPGLPKPRWFSSLRTLHFPSGSVLLAVLDRYGIETEPVLRPKTCQSPGPETGQKKLDTLTL